MSQQSVVRSADTQVGVSLWQDGWRRFVRNRLSFISAIVLVLIHLVVIVGPWVWPPSPEAIAPLNALKGPTAEHPLGTDELGRDTLARLFVGGRISLAVGAVAMVISVGIGTILGAISGFFGRTIDMVFMRFTDAVMALPTIFLLLVILSVFEGGIGTVMIVIGLTAWTGVARLVRSEALRWKSEEFVEAADALGSTRLRTLFRHVLPNAMPSIVVAATLGMARAILVESTLSYLGLGIQPPTPSLGNMLTNAQNYLWNAPIQAVWPGLLILLVVLTYNFVGEGLQDALNPRSGT